MIELPDGNGGQVTNVASSPSSSLLQMFAEIENFHQHWEGDFHGFSLGDLFLRCPSNWIT